MIILTRIDGEAITVNAGEIETVESTHDSTITLRSGRKIIVRQTSEEIIEKVIEFRRRSSAQLPGVL